MQYEYRVRHYTPEMLGDNLSEAIEKGINKMAESGWEPVFVNIPSIHGGWVTFRRPVK